MKKQIESVARVLYSMGMLGLSLEVTIATLTESVSMWMRRVQDQEKLRIIDRIEKEFNGEELLYGDWIKIKESL